MNNFLSFLFVTFLSAFIYACYLYCLQNEYLNSYGRTVRIILGALSAPLFVCYYWSFLKCSFNNPGYVDTTWEANAEENNIQIEKRKIRNYTPNKYTICDKCDFLVRPERAHHCRSCKRCVLKMDHHCPWIGTCVGERNLKFFFLFLSYGLLTTVYIAVTISPKFVLALHESESNKASETLHHGALLISKRKRKNDPPTVCASLTMMIALVFVTKKEKEVLRSLQRLLPGMNCQYVYFISRNITIIESSYTDKNPYDLGTYNNWKMVFGEFKWKWFFPLTPENLYPNKDYLYPLNDIYLNINNVDMDDSFLASHNESLKEENV